MAVSLTSVPNQYNGLAQPFAFGLTMSQGNTATEVRDLTYQLFAEDGTALMVKPNVVPYKPSEFKLDFAPIIWGYVRTTLPVLNSMAPATDRTIIRGFKLRYGEVIFNKITCETTVNFDDESPVYYAINAALDDFRADLFNDYQTIILNSIPNNISMCQSQQAWLYIFSRTSGTIDYLVQFEDDTGKLDSFNYPGGGQVTILPIGTGNGFYRNGNEAKRVRYARLSFRDNVVDGKASFGNASTYHISVDDCCKEGDGALKEIYFQEQLGGISSIRFDTVAIGGNRSTEKVCISKPATKNLPYPVRQRYGEQVSRNQSRGSLILSANFSYEPSMADYLNNLVSSSLHLMRKRISADDGGEVMGKVTVADGGYELLKEGEEAELSITIQSAEAGLMPKWG